MAAGAAALAVVLHLWPVRLARDAQGVQVVSASVTSATVPRSTVSTGTVEPTSSVTVGTTLTGALESVEAIENSVVRTGQVLAHIDARSYQATLDAAHGSFDQAQAELHSDQARLDEAERERSRNAQLALQQSVTQGEIDGLDLDILRLREIVDADQTRLADAYSAVNVAMMNLQLTAIRSPVDGVVISEPGRSAAGDAIGTPPGLFRIATDLLHMQVQTDLDGSDADAVRPGDNATITYQGRSVTGTVLDVRHRSFDPATTRTSAIARIEVANPEGLLRPGVVVAVKLTGSQPTTVVRVPNRALWFKPNPEVLDAIGEVRVPFFPAPASAGAPLSEVWEFNGTEFTAVGVRTGPAEGGWTEVVAGALHPGDRLVTSASLANAGQ